MGDIACAREQLEAAAGAPLYLEGNAFCLEGLAAGDPIRASTALGAAEGLRARTGIQNSPVVQMALQSTLARSLPLDRRRMRRATKGGG